MERNTNVWLDRKVDDWVSKGWISEEARQKIRKSYGRDEQRKSLLTTLPLYALLAVIGLAAAGIALIWGVSQFWYYVSITVRMGLACVLLLITQIGVGAAMFQERQGNLVAEGVALVHCLGIFAVLAMAEQSFYIGWDVTAYVAVCALLCLPVVYLLRSLAALVVMYFLGAQMTALFLDSKDVASSAQILPLARQLLVTNAAFYIPLLGVNLFRFTIQGLGYSNLAVIAGVFEMIARGAVAIGLVPLLGFTAVCYASPAAWVLADLFLVPAYHFCLNRRIREANA